MRCPKCGFISYDHVSKCLKCSKEIAGAALEFQGTTFHATAPSFLTVSPSDSSTEKQAAGDESDGIDFSDGGIDGLFDSEAVAEDEELQAEEDFSFDDLAGEESSPESDDMTMDLGQFEDEAEEEPAETSFDELKLDEGVDDFQVEEEAAETEDLDMPGMDVPDELKDITDLAAPEEEVALEMDEDDSAVEEESPVQDDFSFDELEESPVEMEPEGKDEGSEQGDMDFDGLDLDLDLGEDVSGARFKEEDISEDQLSDMSLSEIDLSGTLGSDESVQEEEEGAADIDPDLDFDLDLYGIKLSEDNE